VKMAPTSGYMIAGLPHDKCHEVHSTAPALRALSFCAPRKTSEKVLELELYGELANILRLRKSKTPRARKPLGASQCLWKGAAIKS